MSGMQANEPPELPEYVERVLEVTERIPAGRVLTYGDIAEWLAGESDRPSGGPRQVGRALALYGGGVPWWRVVRADGVPLPGRESQALAHYRAEGTPLRRARTPARDAAAEPPPRLDLPRARWDGAGNAAED